MTRRAALLGLALMTVPGLVLAALLPPDPAPPRAWPETPTPTLLAQPPARWDEPANESLALLRRATKAEALRSDADLAACEALAARVTGKLRNKHYRTCATRPLARTDGFGAANSHMLSSLAGSAGPSEACRGRVLTLSGMNRSLSFVARSALSGGLSASWEEVLEASRTIRALAGEARRLASAPGWAATCKALPPAEGPVA